jgi:hypothetical protein
VQARLRACLGDEIAIVVEDQSPAIDVENASPWQGDPNADAAVSFAAVEIEDAECVAPAVLMPELIDGAGDALVNLGADDGSLRLGRRSGSVRACRARARRRRRAAGGSSEAGRRSAARFAPA